MRSYRKTFIISALILFSSYLLINQEDQTGLIEGKVTIGPFSPVEPSQESTVPIGTYSSRFIILKPWFGEKIFIPLSEDRYYKAEVRTGRYEVSLSDCVYLGCASALPISIEIKVGETTTLDIDIDTGIR